MLNGNKLVVILISTNLHELKHDEFSLCAYVRNRDRIHHKQKVLMLKYEEVLEEEKKIIDVYQCTDKYETYVLHKKWL